MKMDYKRTTQNLDKYKGIIPAFYACYDEKGDVSPSRVRALTRYFIDKGVKGVYVGGSSGECIYQSVDERKATLEAVIEEGKGKLTIIAHVACNNTKDSIELAKHAESIGVDAIASIPPIYFHLPDYAIAAYWNRISEAAPNTDFIIYNIPQLAGTSLTQPLLKEMLKNPNVVGVKNSSLEVQDIQIFKSLGGPNFIVFNGHDEEFISGRAIGADGGIGGTYGAMPELFLKENELIEQGNLPAARQIQNDIDRIIYTILDCHGDLYAVIKEILRMRESLDIGTVREPLPDIIPEDKPSVEMCVDLINDAIERANNCIYK